MTLPYNMKITGLILLLSMEKDRIETRSIIYHVCTFCRCKISCREMKKCLSGHTFSIADLANLNIITLKLQQNTCCIFQCPSHTTQRS